MWCGIAAFVIWAVHYSREQKAKITVKEVRIVIPDSAAVKVISRDMVARWMNRGGFDPIGKPAAGVDTRAIEEYLAIHPEVRRASVWSDLNGVMTVQVSQRTPIMRVRSVGGYRFFVTDDNYLLPDHGDMSAYVPVVTGAVPLAFGTSARGSYDEMLKANYNDFLGQFTEIELQRRSLVAQRATVEAGIRVEKAKRPKRFWNDTRDSLFRLARNKRVDELRDEVARLNVSLATLATNKATLREKEKKSQQSHHFLTKLVNFVRSVESDDFWSAQVVQINVLGSSAESGGGAWKEPQLELVPRAGNHIVLLGPLDGDELEKLNKLKTFYLGGLWHEGWSEYRYINIKYKDQVVCTK
jgi:cell division protein FtsQ